MAQHRDHAANYRRRLWSYAIQFPCSLCEAPIGTQCKTRGGNPVQYPHLYRHRAARALMNPKMIPRVKPKD